MSPNAQITSVVSEDIDVLGDLLLRSKLALTINRIIWKDWPNEAAQRKQYTSSVRYGFDSADMESFKIVDADTQKLVGYMIMERKQASEPDPHKDPSAAPANSTLPPELDADACAMLHRTLSKINAQWERIERYELVFIVVEQAYRRKGIGSQLMQVCFDKARAAGLPLAVCCEPAAVPFMARIGLQEKIHDDMDLRDWAPPYTGFGLFRLTGMMWYPDSEAK